MRLRHAVTFKAVLQSREIMLVELSTGPLNMPAQVDGTLGFETQPIMLRIITNSPKRCLPKT